MTKPRTLWLVFVLLCGLGQAQTAVNLFNGGQFYSALQNGTPNAFGCVFFYYNNTSTPQDTYTDSTGQTKNKNPVVLTAGGTANIWLINGSLYTVVVTQAGGTNCATGAEVYSVDGINSTLLNTANTWLNAQTFDDPINLLASDLQIVFGSPSGTQTTLDIPPTSANYVLHGPPITGNDTLLSANATQTVENKNLTSGTEVNGCGMTNGPGTYICIPNNTSTATVLNRLAILTGAPSTATVALTTSAGGIAGIVTAGAGIAGNATIQQTGQSNCVFFNATVAGDYFEESAGTGGMCQDVGSSYPQAVLPGVNQVLGRVLATGSGGLTSVELFSPEITAPVSIVSYPATITLGTGAGTGAIFNSCTQTCTDNGGALEITSGSSPPASSLIFKVTFGGTHNHAWCTYSVLDIFQTTISPGLNGVITNTFFELFSGATALGSTVFYQWSYVCNFN